MVVTKIFKSNTTQAVRFPKDVAFPDDVREVEIVVVGDTRIVTPAGRRWDFFFDNGLRVTEDFLADRAQPSAQERSAL
jgi:antitoxin VapB